VAFSKRELANRDAHYLTVAGRLKPGVALQQARADMESVARRIEETNPISARKLRVVLVPLREQLAGNVRYTLIVLLAAVACILLIACANAANLLLSRAIGRSKEMSLRAALGATRPRLLRQLLTESLLLSASGGAAGLLLAKLGLGILTRLVPASMATGTRLELSAPVLLFSGLVSLATAVVFGLTPALRASKLDLNQGLKQSGGRSGAGRSDSRLRSVLVIAETALALVLLVCAQLMIQTFLRLKAVDPGFRAENVVTAGTPLPPRRYADASRRIAFYHQVLERVTKLPGVVSAGYVTALPLTLKGGTRSFQIEGVPPAPGRDALTRQISPDYLRTMGIRILQGRGIEERDEPEAPKVAIISETMAQKFWPNENAWASASNSALRLTLYHDRGHLGRCENRWDSRRRPKRKYISPINKRATCFRLEGIWRFASPAIPSDWRRCKRRSGPWIANYPSPASKPWKIFWIPRYCSAACRCRY
jgi:putative ABC transport system permease protein